MPRQRIRSVGMAGTRSILFGNQFFEHCRYHDPLRNEFNKRWANVYTVNDPLQHRAGCPRAAEAIEAALGRPASPRIGARFALLRHSRGAARRPAWYRPFL